MRKLPKRRLLLVFRNNQVKNISKTATLQPINIIKSKLESKINCLKLSKLRLRTFKQAKLNNYWFIKKRMKKNNLAIN